MCQIPGGFHAEKQGIWPTLKWIMSGTGLEEFLMDSGRSETQRENFLKYSNARHERHFCLSAYVRVDNQTLGDHPVGLLFTHQCNPWLCQFDTWQLLSTLS